MKIFTLACSLRQGSQNKQLARLMASELQSLGHHVTSQTLGDFPLPLYDGDLDEKGKPPAAEALRSAVVDAEAVLLVSPEYNYSIPGPLKNAIDWLSRFRPYPWKDKPTMLLSASPGAAGGSRGLWQLRIPLEMNGALIHPEMFSLAAAHEAFDADGKFKDAKMHERLRGNLQSFLKYAAALRG